MFVTPNGKEIPPESKRLMRLVKSRQLSIYPEWHGFEMINNKLKTPTGQLVTPQEVLAGLALLDIQSLQACEACKSNSQAKNFAN